MSVKILSSLKKQALWFPLIQFLVLCLLNSFAVLIGGIQTLLPLSLGGLISLLPNLFFVMVMFKTKRVITGKQWLRRFYTNEIIKLLLIGVLFIGVAQIAPKHLLAVIIGFFVLQMVSLMMPLIYSLDRKRF